MPEKYSHDLYEALKITEYADKEAKNILVDLDMQGEKLMEIQKLASESKGLLFVNGQLIESARKSIGAKFMVFTLVALATVLLLIFIKVRFY
jgi:hypothetical protein